ncbi:CPBP family intramembrane metalloprotease [Lutibacter sp. B2]|nr:CPBP family intramembrane metalloprotease [Lutibacter sp. B2]
MENQTIKNKFELSICSAVEIVILYTVIILGIIDTPFYFIAKINYFQTHQIAEAIIKVSGEVISRTIIVILLLKKVRRQGHSNFKVKYVDKLNCKLLSTVIFLMIGYYLWFSSSIGIIIAKIPLPKFLDEVFENIYINSYFAVIAIAVIAPIFEEIVMRGIMLEGLLNKYKPQKAIIISALIFGIWHFNIPQFINATLIGLILGVLYYKTNSLILCIVIHITNNTMAIIMDYLEYSPCRISFVVGIGIFIISGILIIKYIKELSAGKSNKEWKESQI